MRSELVDVLRTFSTHMAWGIIYQGTSSKSTLANCTSSASCPSCLRLPPSLRLVQMREHSREGRDRRELDDFPWVCLHLICFSDAGATVRSERVVAFRTSFK